MSQSQLRRLSDDSGWSNDGKEGTLFKFMENTKLDTAKALNANPTKRNQYIYWFIWIPGERDEDKKQKEIYLEKNVP